MFLGRIAAKIRHLSEQAAVAPLASLNIDGKAQALEQLSEDSRITVDTSHGPIHFYASAPRLVSRARNLLSKEPDMIRWIDQFAPNSVFWDIGANVGVFSLYAAANRSTVLAFEPLAANFHILSKNIQLNSLSQMITSYCIALSGSTELGVLNISSATMGSAMSQFGRPGEGSPYTKASDGMHGMIGFTVDDFIRQFNPPFPNYIKLDVDGLELPILQGGAQTFSDSRLRSIMVELSMSDAEERRASVACLEAYGFTLAATGDVQSAPVGSGANHLFIRQARASAR